MSSVVDQDINKAVELLKAGELVVIPTETVYGLAANAFDPVAVDKIYELKNRPRTNPLILHIPSKDELSLYTSEVPEDALKLIEAFWPGPVTLLLKKKEIVPDYITAGSQMVAIRVPRNAKTLQLLQRLPFPLVAPSANPFTYISPTKPEHLLLCYGERTPFILEDGECPEGVESTIIGFEENEPIIYRLGAITLEEIESVLGRSVGINNQLKSSKVNSPGMHKKHYSPRTKLKIETMENLKSIKGSNCGFITFSAPIEGNNSVFLGEKGIKEGLQRLYSTLYDLDQMDLDTIYVEQVPEVDSGRTLMDRLRRSAH